MTYKNYTVKKEEFVKVLNGNATLLEHHKTGAKIFVVKNDDDNKVFNIIFRTPPKDDTGLPHILEHSVLCGSRKYPVKDPFVELAKGSLNTFLNAMTYPDKTMYPVASCNDKDFRNLMDVYLDAVFYPNIYKDERILQQEGWHYELTEDQTNVNINGVVYNEMKGASSSPEQVLFRQIQTSLFADHPYGYDSGGEPEAIPDLTSETFLDFHKTYYHPSNSYIFIYGDIDVEEQLNFLDEAYLGAFDKIDVDSELTLVAPPEKVVEMSLPYAIGSEESTDNRTYLSYNVAFMKPDNAYESIGLEILEYLLLEAPGAPLKEALVKLNIAEDIFGSYDSSLRQPTFSIVAKNSELKNEALFIETIKATLSNLAQDGIEERKLQAALNNFEFKLREADFGQYPKGVIYSIKALDNWLYDMDPFTNFEFDAAFKFLREGVGTGYFEQLMTDKLLNNPHLSVLSLVPDQNLTTEKTAILDARLKAYTDQLSEEEKLTLIEETKALKIYQAEPNSKEALETIPLLSLSDIDREAVTVPYDVKDVEGANYVLHNTFTNNIVYMRLSFDFSKVSFAEVPYMSLLVKLLTRMDTDHYTYSELSDEINIKTGGIKTGINVYGELNNTKECRPRFETKFKCFSENTQATVDLVKEVLRGTSFDDHVRIKELVAESKSRLTMSLMSAGHSVSITRSQSYHSIAGKYKDKLEGIDYYKFLENLLEADDFGQVADKLKLLLESLIVNSNITVMVNTEEQCINSAKEAISDFIHDLPKGSSKEVEEDVVFDSLNEGFKTSSKVQYCAVTGDFTNEGYVYSGHMKVLQTIMSLDYMWKEVRIKGGAYGGFAGFRKTGVFYLGSYRDPNLIKTYEIYDALPEYIRNIDFDDRELSKYIIGTISNLDTPLTPQMKGDKAMGLYMSGTGHDEEQQERDEVLRTSNADLTKIAALVEGVINQNHLCVIGNEDKIEAEKSILREVKALFK